MFNSDTTGDLHSRLRESRPTDSREAENADGAQNKPGTRIRARKSSAENPAALPTPKLDVLNLGAVKNSVREKAQEFASVDHLSVDAAAMFVDNELSKGAMHRARLHILHCAECREEIRLQRETVEFLRTECRDEKVSAPVDLKAKLAGLANECAPGPGAEDLAMQRPDSFVAKVESVVRAVRRTQGR